MAVTLPERAGELNLIIEQGATFNPVLTWKDETGTPIDNSGYSARMQIRNELADTAFLVELTDANGGIVLGGSAGTITLYISATDTAGYSWTEGVYDLEMIDPSGNVRRLLKGVVSVSPEVTR